MNHEKLEDILSQIVHQLTIKNDLQALNDCFKMGLISSKQYAKEMQKYVSYPLRDPCADQV